jgi:hypothetical protein
MSPDKISQKGNLGRRPRSFFNIFNENEQITTNTTADPSVATPASPAEIDTRLPGEKAPLASPTVTVTTDTDTTISDFDLANEEIANSREPSEHATLSIAEMGFHRRDVLVALFAAKCNKDLAVEYLVSGIPQGVSTEVNLGSNASATPDEENTDEDDNEEGLSQEKREQLVVQRTQNKGFSQRDVTNLLRVFRQDRMAAFSLELAGPAYAASPARQAFTDAGQVSPCPALTPQLSLMRRASMISSNASPIDISTQVRDSVSQSGLSTPDHISPYTNAYLATSPPIDPELTNQAPRNEPLKRPLDSSINTTPRCKNQRKRLRAPTPPRYKGLIREEYMRRRFGGDSDNEGTKDALEESEQW